MSFIRSTMIRADDVCAYLWANTTMQARTPICAAARISDAAALLNWYELGNTERIPLMMVIIGEIETAASLQRQDLHTHEEETA